MHSVERFPLRCDNKDFEVQENDIVVVGTDGIWDNLYEEQIQACINPYLLTSGHMRDVQAASNCISTYAEFVSYDEKYLSPFFTEARKDSDPKIRDKYKDRTGGKEDDITIIVSQVKAEKY